MTFAIQHCLLYPERAAGVDRPVDFTQAALGFQRAGSNPLPCLKLAYAALQSGGTAPAL